MSGDQADFLFTKTGRQADGEGGEVQPRVNSLRSRLSHDNRRHNTGRALAGSGIPDTPTSHLSRPDDLIPSMEEVIWKRSSITASIL